ncbi:MAG: hypothetical protein Kow00133_09200 [Amphiplicatus sp.]
MAVDEAGVKRATFKLDHLGVAPGKRVDIGARADLHNAAVLYRDRFGGRRALDARIDEAANDEVGLFAAARTVRRRAAGEGESEKNGEGGSARAGASISLGARHARTLDRCARPRQSAVPAPRPPGGARRRARINARSWA